ncbi:ribonuclease E/G [Belnapia rosea]|uniref:Ribonuclease E n=1 Tax=Belnapia rosea TaxID=938405 RepID=A0A1G6SSC1_9PROT|nr:ribonuclease E/G [Belnapia rosea]SDD19531.1 ribonuclease E [Belnapia rosea]
MTKRMLIDASHAEETRVVVLDGNRLEEFDLEAASRLPLKGNIYLAKVVRVEPSLQAAFVEYGGNRHGFLAFSEIHPDYYQIPVADRQRLLEMQAAEAREEEESEEREAALADALEAAAAEEVPAEAVAPEAEPSPAEPPPAEADASAAEAMPAATEASEAGPATEAPFGEAPAEPISAGPIEIAAEARFEAAPDAAETAPDSASVAASPGEGDQPELAQPLANGHAPEALQPNGEDERGEDDRGGDEEEDAPAPETIGGEGPEEVSRERRIPPRFLRHYKIQEVIRRRQIMLVQVVKEERGTKGAALTTYISLAGRFSVLMPNSPRGGGVSRKITSVTDRKRLREVIDDLGLPGGMSLIVRTAGAQRPKPEIRRDCEYLLRLWDNIRDRTMASTAPALIYEEADLIKRSIRDVYARDVEEILVDGEDAFQEAREFMRMLMPQHAKKIQLFHDGGLFARHQVEAQLDAMHSPMVQLRSGGYLVINQTEALVAIDVNSGRSTRERHIEDTALRTNLEAADEIARQLRLRDLAGLIVIDFIDMESAKHDAMVERRIKEALKHDRARIQVGRISHFGLLEMSRQRLRPSLTETTFVTCPHCQGRGQVRSLESSALQVLRGIEEEAARRRSAEICVHVAAQVAFYLLNRKREKLQAIEQRFGMSVVFEPDDTLMPPAFRLERLRAAEPGRIPEAPPAALRMDYAPEAEPEPEPEAEEAEAPAPAEASEAERAESERQGDRRRRRRRRRGSNQRGEGAQANGQAEGDTEEEGEGEEEQAEAAPTPEAEPQPAPAATAEESAEAERQADTEGDAGRDGPRRRRRGRRGSRPGTAGQGEEATPEEGEAAPAPRYTGPTPADPFAGHVDDIMAAMEAAEAAAEAAAAARRSARIAAPAEPAPEAPFGEAVTEAAPAGPAAEAAPAEVAPAETTPVETAPAETTPVEATLVEATPVETMPGEATPAETTPGDAALAEATPAEAILEPAPAEAVPAPEPEAAAMPEPAPTPEPVPEPAVVQGPIIQPVSVDALDEAAPKRRGWWRR